MFFAPSVEHDKLANVTGQLQCFDDAPGSASALNTPPSRWVFWLPLSSGDTIGANEDSQIMALLLRSWN
jgi:hypothetical protein